MLRVLCIGYCFPPVTSPESYVTAKVMGALPNARVDVLTADPSLLPLAPDHSLDAYVEKRFRHINRIMPSRAIRLMTRMPRLPLRPDRWLLLTQNMVRAAERMGLDNYDCLVTRSQFHSAHLVGLRLKRLRPALPWVASFSDPWSGAVYDRQVPLATAWSERMGTRVLAEADGLVFPTPEMLSFVVRDHADLDCATRSSVVPHGYDASLYGGDDDMPPPSPVRIGLFGSFYGPRSPHPLLRGLAAVRADAAPEFQVEVYGPNPIQFNHALASYPDLASCVRHAGTLDHVTALRRMRAFHLLAMVDAPMAPPSIFLPSKLVDYLGANRSIFAITPDGAAAETVRSAGGFVAPPDDTDAIANALRRAIAAAIQRPVPVSGFERTNYSVDRVATKLLQSIERAIEQCAGH